MVLSGEIYSAALQCGYDNCGIILPEDVKGAGVPVYNLNEIAEKKPEGCRIAILTISREVQPTVDLLVKNGIKGLVSFVSDHFTVPANVHVKQIDVVSSIQELVFEANSMQK